MIAFSSLFLVAAGVVAGDNSQSSSTSSLFPQHSGEACFRHVSWDQGCRQLPVARGWEESCDAEVGRGRDGLHPRSARSSGGAGGDSSAADSVAVDWERDASDDCGSTLFLYQARGDAEPAHPLCARGAQRGGPRSRRRQHARGGWDDCARLVSAQREREVCCLRNFSERVGDEHAAHHRDQDWHRSARHHRAHAGCVDRLEARQLRFLLHALSEKRGCG